MTTALSSNGFLWGASTSAHQIEGGNTNNDFWRLENALPPETEERSGDACDSYHRWREDLDIVASLGLNSYRFSLEWSRIMPTPDHVSRAALGHYRRIIEGCHARGLTPVVTLHHFTNPLWFADRGGWRNAANIGAFEQYVRAASTILADVSWVCTINEPNMLALLDPAASDDDPSPETVLTYDPVITDVAIAAHRSAVSIIRSETDAQVGWTIANQNYQSAPGAEGAAEAWSGPREDVFIAAGEGDDFIGVQAYTRTVVEHERPVPLAAGVERTLTGWEYYPAAAAEAAVHTAKLLPRTPILVTENGIATDDDDRRIEYTRESLRALAAVASAGVDLRGYLHWSLLDNYEWGSYRPRFGLVEVDPQTFERTVKPSGVWLGGVAASGGASL